MQQPDYGAKFMGKGGEFLSCMNSFFLIIFFISSRSFPLHQYFGTPEGVGFQYYVSNKNALQRLQISLACRLDREIRRRLILHETLTL